MLLQAGAGGASRPLLQLQIRERLPAAPRRDLAIANNGSLDWNEVVGTEGRIALGRRRLPFPDEFPVGRVIGDRRICRATPFLPGTVAFGFRLPEGPQDGQQGKAQHRSAAARRSQPTLPHLVPHYARQSCPPLVCRPRSGSRGATCGIRPRVRSAKTAAPARMAQKWCGAVTNSAVAHFDCPLAPARPLVLGRPFQYKAAPFLQAWPRRRPP